MADVGDTLGELHATGKLPEQIDAAIAILDASDIDYADVHGSRGCVFQHIENYQNLPTSLQEFADDNAPREAGDLANRIMGGPQQEAMLTELRNA